MSAKGRKSSSGSPSMRRKKRLSNGGIPSALSNSSELASLKSPRRIKKKKAPTRTSSSAGTTPSHTPLRRLPSAPPPSFSVSAVSTAGGSASNKHDGSSHSQSQESLSDVESPRDVPILNTPSVPPPALRSSPPPVQVIGEKGSHRSRRQRSLEDNADAGVDAGGDSNNNSNHAESGTLTVTPSRPGARRPSGSSKRRTRRKKKRGTSSSSHRISRIAKRAAPEELLTQVVRLKKRAEPEKQETLDSIAQLLEQLREKDPQWFTSQNHAATATTDTTAAGDEAASAKRAGRKPNRAAPTYDEGAIRRAQEIFRTYLTRRTLLNSREAVVVRQRLAVWEAFIASEKRYFVSIMTVLQSYLRPLRNQATVTENELNQVFGNIDAIKDQSKAFLSRLRADSIGEWIASTEVGSVFNVDMLPGLKKNYVTYVVEFPKRVASMGRLLKKSPEFKEFLDRTAREAGSFDSLTGLLLAPLHRMNAYEWTLEELLRLTPEGHASMESLSKAYKAISQLNLTLAVQKRAAIRAQKLADASVLSSENMESLSDRVFLREGPVYVVDTSSSRKATLYLFSDVVGVGELSGSGINFSDVLSLKHSELTEAADTTSARYMFVIQGRTGVSQKTLRLSCSTLEEKKSWMNDINMAINSLVSDKQLAIATDNKELSDADLEQVAKNMLHPASGVPVKTRKRRMQVFANAFVGSDAVDWLVRNYNLPRRAAVELGQRLLKANFFHHVSYNQDFADKKELYEFQELGEGSNKMPDSINMQELVKKMFHPQQGVILGAKKGRFGMKKKNVFAGSDAVDWMSKNLKVQRHIAITIGNMLLEHEFFRGVNTEVFADEKAALYRIRSGTMEDLSFPTERVLKSLKDLKSNPQFKGNPEDLEYVIRMLTSGGNLYTSNIMAILDKDTDLDQDTKQFVLSYAGDQGSTVRRRFASHNPSLASSLSLTMSSDASERSPLIRSLVAKVDGWDFPIFALAEESNGTPLYAMGYALFIAHDLINKFNIEEKKLAAFLMAMNNGYRDNTYHNAIHAGDVSQTLNFFISSGGLRQRDALTDTDIFAAVLAAIVHDFDHRGVNNAFMINSRDEIAIRYNDISVLENHHVASAFFILQKEECNIFSNCPLEVYKEVRETTIRSVLATDFGKHFDILGQFKSKVASGGFDFGKIEDRRLILQVALKCADISHTAKSQETHCQWTERITEEFYRQGDAEREKQLPLSPYMDRKTGNLPKSQIGFIGFLVQPLYEAWVDVFEESLPALEGVQANLRHWKSEAEKQDAAAASRKSTETAATDTASAAGTDDEEAAAEEK